MQGRIHVIVGAIALLLAACGSDDTSDPSGVDAGTDMTVQQDMSAQEQADQSPESDAAGEDACTADEFRDSTGACAPCPAPELSCDAVGEVQVDIPTNTVSTTIDDSLEVATARLSGTQSETMGLGGLVSPISADGTVESYNELTFVLEPDAASERVELNRLTVTDSCGQESEVLILASWSVGGTGTTTGMCTTGPPR